MTQEAPGSVIKRRGGRPPSKKRGTFSFRVTADLRAKLEQAATEAGKPVSEEIEARLEASFRDPAVVHATTEQTIDRIIDRLDRLTTEKFGGEHSRYAGEEFGRGFNIAKNIVEERLNGTSWYENESGVEEMRVRLRRAPDVIIDMVLHSVKAQPETPQEFAARLGLKVDGPSKKDAQAALARYFDERVEQRRLQSVVEADRAKIDQK